MDVDLSAIGLTAVQERLYRSLVDDGGGTSGALAARWGLSVDGSAAELAGLQELGLVEQATFEDDEQRWYPTAPEVSLQALLNARRHALSVAETSVAWLAEVFRRDINHAEVGHLVEGVLGAAAVRQRFLQLELSARSEICTFVDARPVAVAPAENRAEDEALDRGVVFRVVMERAAFEDEATLAEARTALGASAQIRAVPAVPTKLLIADGNVAMVPLSIRGYDTAALVIRAPSLVHSLAALFESVWANGVPLALGPRGDLLESPAAGPDAVDLTIVSLMLAGLTDDAVGEQVGMSGRSVQRRIKALMEHTGSMTRMQLGWEAAERGWVTRR